MDVGDSQLEDQVRINPFLGRAAAVGGRGQWVGGDGVGRKGGGVGGGTSAFAESGESKLKKGGGAG